MKGRRFMLLAGFIGAVGLILQGYLTFQLCMAKGFSVPGAVFKFFSYFTILTNVLVVASHATGSLLPGSRLGRFFARDTVRAGLLLYITFVLCTYALLLQHLWEPQGLQWVADVTLHYVTPVLFVVFWICLVPKSRLPWSVALKWLVYPLVYLGCIMVRGEMLHDYPYPFVDAGKQGYPQTLANAAMLMAAFLVASVILIGVSRWICRKDSAGHRPDAPE